SSGSIQFKSVDTGVSSIGLRYSNFVSYWFRDRVLNEINYGEVKDWDSGCMWVESDL
ncbi:34020_t:CDS:2, partial [Gigaspora margarita]